MAKVGQGRLTTEEFITRAKARHGGKYDYSKVKYTLNSKKVIIGCPIHGWFFQIAQTHFSAGCRKCGLISTHRKNIISENEFIERATKTHNGKYKYKNYTKFNDKVTCICPVHGEFYQQAITHVRGRGCPKCNFSKGEERIADFLKFHNIPFERQKTFENCNGLGGGRLAFDFQINAPELFFGDVLFIEFDGEQHDEPCEFFGGTESFLKLKAHDKIKEDFVFERGDVMVRIKYKDLSKIDKILGGLLCLKY
jgi:hypothetical protein